MSSGCSQSQERCCRICGGSDAIRRIEAKNAFVAQELARWRDLAVSTDATSA
jgi:hypothetical protein